jgi:quercetin dioxygenase-like cupin family protein
MPRRHCKTLSGYARIFFWIAAAAASVWAQQPTSRQAPDPLKADPQHTKLELENQWVRVFQEHLGPHETMPMHQHPGPGAVIVFLTDRNNHLVYFDGTAKDFHNPAGDVIWAAPTTHKSENSTGAQFAALQIEPKPVANAKPFPTESTDAVIVDPTRYQVIVENEWIRAIRVTVGAHEKLKMHKHPATGAVVIYLSDQDMRQFHADGTSHESHFKAGTVRWVPPDAAHQDENIGDKPFRLIRIELKQAQN